MKYVQHVGDPTFGEEVSISQQIQKIVDTSPKLKFTDAQLLLLDTYETGYGICNHTQFAVDNSRPLALVAMHWAESNSEQSAWYERIEQFKERQVYHTFGLSLIEFLDLPRDICIKILDICGKKQTSEGKITDDLQRRFDSLGKTP